MRFDFVTRLRLRGGKCAALLVIAALIGCGSAEPGQIVLRVANWSGAKEGNEYDKLVERIYRDFEAAHPGVVIREENVPGEYVAKMSLAYIAKSQPDVLMLDASSAALFIDGGMVADLMPFVRRDPEFKLDAFFPNVLAIGQRGDRLFAVPQDFTPMVVYLNKRRFAESGVPLPGPDWTFEDFREIARRLTGSGKYGFAFTNWMPGWVMWLWNSGGGPLDPGGKTASGFFDGQGSLDAIQFLADLVRVDRSAPSASQTASMGVDPFVEGEAAMTVSGHWAMVGYKAARTGPDGKPTLTWDDLAVRPMPRKVGPSQTVMYESGFALSAYGRHKDLAWEFVKYMTSYRVQKIYQSSGIAICGRRDVAEERARESALEAEFLPIVPTARPPYGSWIEGYDYVEDQGKGAMDAVLDGKPPAAAFGLAARKIDREFAKK